MGRIIKNMSNSIEFTFLNNWDDMNCHMNIRN